MVMSIRSRRKILIAVELTLAAGICLVIWWAFGTSFANTGHFGGLNVSVHTSNNSQSTDKINPTIWYTQVMKTPLRRPLYDPKPEPPKVVQKVQKPLRLQLLGTIIEGSKSSAIIKTSRGDTKFIKTGDIIEEAELIQIASDRVLFNFDGRQVELTRPQDGAAK